MIKKQFVTIKLQAVAFQGRAELRKVDLSTLDDPNIKGIFESLGITDFSGWVELGGCMISPERFEAVYPHEGSTLNIVSIPLGGGDDGKSIRTTLTTIAILATASWIAGPIMGGHFELWAGGSIAKGVATTAIAAMMSQALIAPQRQNRTNRLTESTDPESRSYTITRFRNTPNPNGVYPVIYGKHKLFPAPGAEPYSEIVGNDIYFRQLFVLGYGPIDVSEIKIGETAIASYSDVTHNIKEGFPDDSDLSIYTNDIHTTAVDAIVVQATPVTRTSETATTRLSVDVCFKGGLFALSAEGRSSQWTVQILIEYSIKDAGSWSTATTLTVTEESSSVVWRNHSWDVSENQYDVRVTRITSDIGAYNAFHFYALKSIADSAPIAIDGMSMIEVRIKATDQLNGIIDTLSCVAESYIPVYLGQYTDITAVAATNGWTSSGTNLDTLLDVGDYIQVSGFTDNDNNYNYRRDASAVMAKVATIGAFAATFSNLVTVANEAPGDTIYIWKLTKTRNPAWAYVDMARGKATLNPLLDTRLSISALNTWATNCDTASRYFDFVLDAETTLRQIMDDTAGSGRGSYSLLDGKLSIVEDTLQSTVKQMITTRNSWGLRGHKSYIKQPQAFRLQFVNEDAEYTWDERIVYTSGYNKNNTTEFETIRLLGITDPDLVWKEGMYRLAVMEHRPETFTVNMDFERILIDGRGNLVLLANDAILVGLKSGRVTAVTLSGTDMTHIVVDETCTMAGGTDYGVTIRLEDNTYIVSEQIVTNAGAQTTLEFSTPIDTTSDPYPAVGDLFEFGEHESETMRCIVTGIRPRTKDSAVVSITNEGPAVYTADSGAIPAYVTNITIPAATQQKIPPTPIFLNIRSDESVMVRQGRKGDWITRVLIGFAPPTQLGLSAMYYQVRWKRADETQWHKESAVLAEANEISILGLEDTVVYDFQVRSTSGAGLASLWDTASAALTAYTVIGKSSDPSDITDFAAAVAGEKIRCTWTKVVDKDVSDYEIRYGGAADTWAAMSATAKRTGDVNYWLLDALIAGTYKIAIKAVDTTGNYSATEDTAALIINRPLTPSDNGTTVDRSYIQFRWTSPKTSFPIETCVIKRGSVEASAEEIGRTDSNVKTWQEIEPGDHTFWITAIDTAGNESENALQIDVTTSLPAGTSYVQKVTDGFTGFLGLPSSFSKCAAQTVGGVKYLYLPVDIEETWAEHFTDNSANTFQDLIDAGYEKFAEPMPSISTFPPLNVISDCYYFSEEQFYISGFVYQLTTGCRVKFDFTKETLLQGAGLLEIYPEIVINGTARVGGALSQTFNGAYDIVIPNAFSFVERVRIKLYFRCTGTDHLIRISDLRCVLVYPEKRQSGVVEITANPTTIELDEPCAKIKVVTATHNGAQAYSAQATNYRYYPPRIDLYLADKDGNGVTGANVAYQADTW